MSNIQVKITLSDKRLEEGELQEKIENLLEDIQEQTEVESAGLLPVENTKTGAKSIGGFLLGVLTAEIKAVNIKSFFRFLSDRLLGKTIELEVTANGKTLKVKASSADELNTVIKTVQEFVGE
ncbi:MAG TPA: hypothetical protein VK184_20995 [Nostocaceae cyanobacterium]|nr:hypothetical protein [Nostocaceae cyanobacterium]